ncbi:CPBP family intramembrane glutamate endopeptidase [Streptococcus pluranimalium]|uniref:CPBP family intramembrane glutamate endopeptidase n=1 Tax=Streptococcus pluranimalium TaxID=82348 RepID=UPI002A7A5586|nr:CPBP family intramembrane glutamate endopeptidase [Streptococcus pluranimalium]
MKRLTDLKWFDILILTSVMFGEATILAVIGYQDLLNQTTTAENAVAFTTQDNYNSLILQGFLLSLAFLYLWVRKFDFKRWNIEVNMEGLGKAVILFIGAAFLMDVFFIITQPIAVSLPFPMPLSAVLTHVQFSSVIYALLNGFYEEVFFLGICMSVARKDLKWVIPFSFFIRFIFHIYQGMVPAYWHQLGIWWVFIYFISKILRQKSFSIFYSACYC